MPAILLAIGFVFSIGTKFAQISAAKAESKQLRESIQAVYLKVVPNGRVGDEERRLETLLSSGNKKNAEPTNLMTTLSSMSKAIKSMDSVSLSSFRYSGDQRELQVNLEVTTLAELNKFKEQLKTVGLDGGSPRSTAKGDIYQARMKIKEL